MHPVEDMDVSDLIYYFVEHANDFDEMLYLMLLVTCKRKCLENEDWVAL